MKPKSHGPQRKRKTKLHETRKKLTLVGIKYKEIKPKLHET